MPVLCRVALRTRIPRATSLVRKTFFSYEHPPSSQPFGTVEDVILSAAYQHVPEHGFSHHSISLGARDTGYLDISPSVLSNGVFSLIRFHLVRQRLNLAYNTEELFDTSEINSAGTSAGSRVAAIAWARLIANKDIIHRWQEALAIMAQPSHVPSSLKELALLSDEILHLAGDKSVDSSWYSKRASLSTTYSASELFMTNDKSAGFADTHAFLMRRLDEATTIEGVFEGLGTWTNFTMNAGINLLRSKGVNI
ncbi:Ubiquinone biosynthesis protein coq9, mitochondrial [Conoideocrella luteorostrata]|uniref:Ubiquinone biosynthesis protein n=1 Tax=Conoideocrella luteorostrata TaxID=1105319 RepID=A0AAJ0CZ44_9HYPO|nr:Ubiquinone biosynthesis protein coq9, mitochondrial [Conoideocrella luteorostrata]